MTTSTAQHRRAEVLHAVKTLTAARGMPPTQRELADHVGLSRSGTRLHLMSLARDGLLHLDPSARRAIVVTRRGHRAIREANT